MTTQWYANRIVTCNTVLTKQAQVNVHLKRLSARQKMFDPRAWPSLWLVKFDCMAGQPKLQPQMQIWTIWRGVVLVWLFNLELNFTARINWVDEDGLNLDKRNKLQTTPRTTYFFAMASTTYVIYLKKYMSADECWACTSQPVLPCQTWCSSTQYLV